MFINAYASTLYILYLRYIYIHMMHCQSTVWQYDIIVRSSVGEAL